MQDQSMGLGCVPYLPKVLPDFFHTIRTCEDSLKEFITWKLGTLVSIVRQVGLYFVTKLLLLAARSSLTILGCYSSTFANTYLSCFL